MFVGLRERKARSNPWYHQGEEGRRQISALFHVYEKGILMSDRSRAKMRERKAQSILMSDRSRVKMRERKERSLTHVPNKRGNGTNREMKPGRPEKAERYIKESINCIE